MAELADALDLGSSGATRTGSIPASCTKMMNFPLLNGGFVLYRYINNILGAKRFI